MIPAEWNKKLVAAAACGLLAFEGSVVLGGQTPAFGAEDLPPPSSGEGYPGHPMSHLWGDPLPGDGPAGPYAATLQRAPWRVVASLDNLLADLNTLAPNRDRSSDGSIGDAGHAARPSGHNPDETSVPEDHDADHRNEVRARDFDVHLNRRGVTMEMVTQYLVHQARAGRITWIKYMIFNRRIWSASDGWVTRAYTGANPHDGHLHVSAKADVASENDTSPLGLVSTLRREAGGAVDRLAVNRLTGATRLGRTFYTRGRVTARWSTSTPTAFVSHFEVLVDGRAAARVPGGRRVAVLRLPPGRHGVRVRAVHLSGRVTQTQAYTLIADRTAPTFSRKPVVALHRGAVRGGAVPLSLGWQATDGGGLRWVTLSKPSQARFDADRTGWLTSAPPNTPTTWALRATDRSGNVTDETVTRTPALSPETEAARSGAWVTAADPAYLDAGALRSTTAGSALTWTFTGRGASLVFSRTSRSGKAVVAVDGRPVATLDLRSTATAHRQVAWAYNWRSSGTHTVTVTAQGTPGRPDVVVDGLAHLR